MRFIKLLIGTLCTAIRVATSACRHFLVETGAAEDCPSGPVSFGQEMALLLRTNCGLPGCYVLSSPAKGLFVDANDNFDYQVVKGEVDNGSFNNGVVVQKDLPPIGNLLDSELNRMAEWLTAGAPNN
ncbi:MAG: hypothetical protein ACFB10_05305 [Salibacteraceae bacterium]